MKIKLRDVRIQPFADKDNQGIILSDPLGISDKALFIPNAITIMLALMDGTRDMSTIKTGFELRTGIAINQHQMEDLVSQLDDALFLENERFAQAFQSTLYQYRSARSRPPILTGQCYPAKSNGLCDLLKYYMDRVESESTLQQHTVNGIICPHIDFARGGPIYAEVWQQAQSTLKQVELIVILGTDHNEAEGKITLTCQDYETPLGVLTTSKELVNLFASEVPSCFDHELNHRNEHSVETAIVWAQYLLGGNSCEFLPILCGSFHQFMRSSHRPSEETHVSVTIDILKKIRCERNTLIVAAADLAHMGPVFSNYPPLNDADKARIERHDRELLTIMEQGTADEFFAAISVDNDRRLICGIPPIYITMSILKNIPGKVTGYAQCPASDDGTSVVSICGIVY